MSTPSRPARSETRFCRVPQWLYGSGVSLQAIATYGWLHGRYGHFERITPSYATLAKELGVSRGSVISYVKELQAAGAVRVITSGAAGRQTNEFAIAFDTPFATESTGQHSDQSAGRPVSGLYRTGQPADPGGQRAVQEKDVSLKTYEDSLSSDAPEPDPPTPPAPPDERETNAARNNKRLTAAQEAIRATAAVAESDEPAFIAWAVAEYQIRSPGWWRTTARDLPEIADRWRATQQTRQAAPQRPRGELCGCCGTTAPAACHYRGRAYCTACTTTCTTCHTPTPTDQMPDGRCADCHARSTAA